MATVPRHRFVPAGVVDRAYEDRPQRIGLDQTISQPYIVALMTQLAEVRPGDRVLEIGTGSGYQAAVLAHLGAEVYSIELLEPLSTRAATTLGALGYSHVHLRVGDGYLGWPEHAPFAAIVVTAAPPEVPQALLDQLADGGRLVAPVGDASQQLILITRHQDRLHRRPIAPVRFVPMIRGDTHRGSNPP